VRLGRLVGRLGTSCPVKSLHRSLGLMEQRSCEMDQLNQLIVFKCRGPLRHSASRRSYAVITCDVGVWVVGRDLTTDPEVPGLIPDFLRSSESGTGSTQPREDN
jgi:hypothetical protein